MKIELTEKQLDTIYNQQRIDLGLPSLEEHIKFIEKCDETLKGLRKLR